MISSQIYSRLSCFLCVNGLVFCFYLGWSGSIPQFRQNIIKVGAKSWLLTCSSNITLSLPSYNTGSALKRELNFCNGYLILLYFCPLLSALLNWFKLIYGPFGTVHFISAQTRQEGINRTKDKEYLSVYCPIYIYICKSRLF